MSEQDLVKSILHWLHLHGAFAIRVNSGARVIEEENGRRRIFRGAPTGTPDIIACWPGGLFLSIECKIGRNIPTVPQAETLAAIRTCGGLAVVAYSIDDVENALRERITNA